MVLKYVSAGLEIATNTVAFMNVFFLCDSNIWRNHKFATCFHFCSDNNLNYDDSNQQIIVIVVKFYLILIIIFIAN